MMNIKKNSEISIVAIDPYDYKGFRYHNSNVDAFNFSKTVNKRDFFISYIKFKDLKTVNILVPKSVDKDSLYEELHEKVYAELSLDPALDNRLFFSEENHIKKEERVFTAFVVTGENLNSTFKAVAKKVPYIDYLAPEPLIYSAIYKKGLLPSTQADCFIALRKDESFLSIYLDGDFFTAREIRYNLNYLKDKFLEQSGDRLSDDKFLEVLSQRGLVNKDDDGFNYDLNTVFEDYIFYFNDILNIINSQNGIAIKKIYIDCDYEIKNFANFISTKLGLDAEYINIKVAINNKNYTINERYNVMALFGRFYTKEPFYENFNLSNMLRPDPFVKRKSGKFLLTCAAAFALSMLYPAYNYIAGLVLEKDSARLNDEYSVLNAQEMQIKETLAKISREQETVKEQTQKENEKLNFRKGLLAEIENKKDNYAMKGLNLFKITDILNLNAVHITNIVNNDRNFTITAVSDNEKRITQLIKDISKDEKYLVNTKKIRSDDAKHEYESNISIEIRQ